MVGMFKKKKGVDFQEIEITLKSDASDCKTVEFKS